MRTNHRSTALRLAFAAVVLTNAARGDDEPAYRPTVAPASEEGEKAIARFRVPQGLKVELFAAEPLLANPVAIANDDRNRWFVVETFRHSDGVTDTRGHMNWLVDDLASKSVDDRVAMYKKYLSPAEFAHYSVEHERIRLVEDRDGDGKAETSTVFADGFNSAATGLGAGVLPHHGDVFFTCIPDLWRLRDSNGDGMADDRTSLHNGYGVHVQFIGHDLHGLIVGPDGRLYFTVGDRGLNVTTAEGKQLVWTESGAVLRCDLDGSNLEIIHVGLRNPQELAFDEYGNLFTVDNNSDGGDRARLVWVVPGGDSGWRVGYQFIERPGSRGPWNAEKMWHPEATERPAFVVPALANFSDGPGGLAYNPGTALRPEDRDRFYLADFRGSAGDSGVRSFAVRPKGAAFELADEKQFVWGLEATDVAFGTDGGMYISDWVEGWNKTGKGRIYRVFDPDTATRAASQEVGRLLATGMADESIQQLAALFQHTDMRVRAAAQSEFVSRALASKEPQPEINDPSSPILVLTSLANGKSNPTTPVIARLHAIWALAQIERATTQLDSLLPLELMQCPEPAVRITLAQVLADPKSKKLELNAAILIAALKDPEPRVRFFAAIAAGHSALEELIAPLCNLLQENADQDAYLRHAAVMGLAGIAKHHFSRIVERASDASPSVRLGILLVLRRLESPDIALFLNDPDPRLVLEAARAINDLPINGALGKLAELPIDGKTPTPLLRRTIAARLRRGTESDAHALADLASSPSTSSNVRIEAIESLSSWADAVPLDRITGLYRPIPKRASTDALSAFTKIGPALFADESDLVVQAAAKAAAGLKAETVGPALVALANDAQRSSNTRIEALKALETLAVPQLSEVVLLAMADSNRNVRAEALAILSKVDPPAAYKALSDVLRSGSIDEQQRAFATLANIDEPKVDELLSHWVELAREGKVAAALKLDIIDAAEKRTSPELRDRLAKLEATLSSDNPLTRYEVALEGGRAQRGERLFREKAEVSCVKCHKVRGQGGEVGPELTGIGSKKDRRYLLEALVLPDKQIAEGFDTKVLALKDGTVLAGIVKKSDQKSITLIDAEARLINVPRERIEEESSGQSAMPQDLVGKLTRQELRDLVEYLSGLK
jgi:quinoprotein glucose dehydrogenase